MRKILARITPLPTIVLVVVGTGVYLMFMPLADAVPVIFGGFISAVISYAFAWLASKELRAEAESLRQETREVRYYVDALISYVEAAGIDVPRTPEGKPSRVIRREVTDQLGINDTAKPTLTDDEGEKTDANQDS